MDAGQDAPEIRGATWRCVEDEGLADGPFESV